MSARSAGFRIFRSSKKGKDWQSHMLYGMASAGTVAWVMYQKFCNGLPYYRQEKDWKQYGVEITRATMANWVIRNSEAFFLPMYEYFHRKLLERGFAMADETPLQVLHEPERRAQTKSYMWLFRSGEDGGIPIILYKYSETRAGDNAVDFLHGFKGYLMCDGYSGYNKVQMPNAQLAGHTSEDIWQMPFPKEKLGLYPAIRTGNAVH